MRVLDPEVVLRPDGGGMIAGVARRPVIGSDRVARLLIALAARRTSSPEIRPVNGSAGLVFTAGGEVAGVMGFTVASNLITEIDFVLNPEKLRRAGKGDSA